MAKVLITGGSGLIGKMLTKSLISKGYEVVHLGRKAYKGDGYECFKWDILSGQIDEKAFESLDYVVHLAGAPIADTKWNAKGKKEIIDSRVKGSELIQNVILKKNISLKAFIGASAIGYYGAVTNETIYVEEDSFTNDFLGSTCKAWEDTYSNVLNFSARKVIVRVSVVLSKDGGAYKKLISSAKFGFAACLGTGKQYMPWIHIDDMVSVFMKAIEDEKFSGIYNATSSEHTTNKEFTKKLCKSIKRPFLGLKAPAFFLKLILGEMAVMVLEGSRVSNQKLLNTGFDFKFKELDKALEDLSKK